jgi:hypothetical protein
MPSAGIRFNAVIPENARPELLWAEMRRAQTLSMKSMQSKAEAVTAKWKHKVEWKSRYASNGQRELIMIWTNDKIFGYVEHGTKRHFVAPKNKKALHWPKGVTPGFFSKGHWVSGIKARQYLKKIRSDFEREYRRNMQEAMRTGASRTFAMSKATPGRIQMR